MGLNEKFEGLEMLVMVKTEGEEVKEKCAMNCAMDI